MSKELSPLVMRGFRKSILLLVLFSFFSSPINQLMAQGYFGIRATPNLTASPKVSNNSPATISTGTSTALEAGIDYTFMLNRKWGLSAGTDFGASNWSYNLQAPIAAFAAGAGSGMISKSQFHNYLYNSATFNTIYRIPAEGSHIRIFAGPTFRIRHSYRSASTRGGNGSRADASYNDADGGTPDLVVEYPSEKFQIVSLISAGIGYERHVSENLDVLLGIRTNWGLTTTTNSIMTLNMNNQLYRGLINTNSNYIGFDVAFRFKTASRDRRENLKQEF